MDSRFDRDDDSRRVLRLDPCDEGVFIDMEDAQDNLLTHSTSPEACESILRDGEYDSRPVLRLDPSDEGVFIDMEDVQDNVLTHSTSPDACESILRDGEFKGSVPSERTYDGLLFGVEPRRAVFFMANPSSDGALFPFSRYPRSIEDGAPIRIISIAARRLLADELKLFYVASTPTQFGQEFMRVYQSHVFAVREDDVANLELAEKHFTSLDIHRSALICFHGDQARIATRVRVGDKSYPNAVVISFCDNLKFEPGEARTLDGNKVAFHNGKVTCPRERCSYRSKSMHSLKTHFREMHLNLRVYACQKCDMSFSQRGNLTIHNANLHDKERHRCSQCDKSFSHKGYLKTHVANVHENERPHRCLQCDKSFSRSSTLRTHVASVHDKTRSHRCLQCDKSFSHKSSLSTHVADVHEKRQPHRCTQCDKSFSRKINLSTHVAAVHEKRRPHQCAQCDRTFSQKVNLTTHVANVHEKERPHQCTQCDKTFLRKDHLNTHVALVHENKRSHWCPRCDKSFSSKGGLNTHVASVHEKRRPNLCTQCDKTFSQKSNLRTHIANVHEKKLRVSSA